MKKLGIILLSALSALSLAACGGSASSTESAVNGEASANASSSTDGDRTLIMSTNAEFPPYIYYDNGTIVGIDAEIAQAIAEELGATLEITDMAFDAIIPAVQSGKGDFGAGGVTITEDRMKNVDFTETYAVAKQAIIVKPDSDIKAPEDMEGKLIGVQQGTTGDIYTTDDFGESSVQRFPKGTDAVQALRTDKIDCVVIDDSTARAFLENNEDLVILDTAYTEEEYAFCVAKGNEELLNELNTAIANLKESGKLEEITAKYIVAE